MQFLVHLKRPHYADVKIRIVVKFAFPEHVKKVL